MGTNDSWIESTEEALHARMRRVRESKEVQQSTLLANQHLGDCKRILLVSSEEELAGKDSLAHSRFSIASCSSTAVGSHAKSSDTRKASKIWRISPVAASSALRSASVIGLAKRS